MARSGRTRRAFAAAFLAAAISAATSASAFAADTIVTTDDSFNLAVYAMDQGEKPTLQNAGVNNHNATARTNGPDGAELFASPTIGTGTTTVEGTQYLTTGTYAMFCTTHPLTMQANLQVSALGTPVARPNITVALGSGKLAKLAKKGKVPVTVTATTASNGVEVAIKLGKSTLGTQSAFNLAAGQSRKLSVKLGKSGKKKLAGRKSAKLIASGTVPFGSPKTAKRTYK
jgi:plastocyanin